MPEHKLLHDLSLPSFTDPTSCHSTPPLIYLNETGLLTDRYTQNAISYCQAFAHTVSSSQNVLSMALRSILTLPPGLISGISSSRKPS